MSEVEVASVTADESAAADAGRARPFPARGDDAPAPSSTHADADAFGTVRTGRARLWLLALASLVWLCGYAYVSLDTKIRAFSDTDLMRNIANKALRFPDLFFEAKPFLYPLALRIVGDDLRLLVVAQTLVYFAAWGTWLWLVVTRPQRIAVAIGLAVLCVNFALYPEFASWNHLILSESFSISLTVLAAALLWLALERKRWYLHAAWLGALVLGTGVRDFGGYYGLALAPLLLCLRGLRRIGTAGMLGGLLVLGANFFVAFYTGEHAGKPPIGGRWAFEMLNNIGRRILPDPTFRAFFVAHGMPMNDALAAMSGKWAHENDQAFYEDPQLEDFRHWVADHSKTTYALALLQSPRYVLDSLNENKEDVLQWSQYTAGFYPDQGYLKRSFFRIEHQWLHALNVVVLGLLLALAWRRRARVAFFLAAACAWFYLILWPLAFFAFHADAMEIGRHCLPVSLQNVLALLLSLLCLERIIGRDSRPLQAPASRCRSSV